MKPPSGSALHVQALRYTYPDGTEALRGVDFDLDAGRSMAIFGANGSGKTTFLLHLNGLLRGEGTILVCGEAVVPATMAKVRARVGMIFQNSDDQLFMPTVLEDVCFGLLQKGWKAGEAKDAGMAMLDRLHIRHVAEKAPYHLSSGEKKRVALAGVLLLDPAVLVLDEPTTYLDPPGQRDLAGLLNSLSQAKVIATHDVEFAAEVASHAVFFEQGRLCDSGSIAEVSGRHRWRVFE